jgi:hypothetical protein
MIIDSIRHSLVVVTMGFLYICLAILLASLSRPTHSSWKSVNFRFLAHTRSEEKILDTLWDSVGCDSKHPILSCKTLGQKLRRKTFFTRFHDVKNVTYLNSTRHSTCSLVGSSGNLRNHAYGERIDKSNIVIQINNPPVKGYEEFAGLD